jgi:hypothetical protein
MNDARPYASLSSGLLARKGTAKPAMRPQGYGNLEDLGWNDMGQAPGEVPPAPEHVPSSIAALTPAPKIQRTNPGDAHLPSDAGDYGDYEGGAWEEAEAFEEEELAPELRQTEPVEFAPQPAEPEAHEPELHQPEPEAYEPEPEAYEPDIYQPEPEAYAPEPEACEPEPAPAFEAPSVVAQQRAILEQLEAEPEEHEPAPVAAAPGRDARAEVVPLPKRVSAADKRKAAFTLRLDAERHLRLRLACAVTRHSAQQIVARALDEALAGIPEIEALASQVPVKPGRAGKSN